MGIAGPLFEEVVSPENLLAAWKRIDRHGGPTPGGDGVGKAEFRRSLQSNIAVLAARLRTDTYSPGPVRHLQFPKKNGEFRKLSIPCMIDRVAQKSMSLVLDRVLDEHFETSSFAYRHGRSVKLAAQNISMAYRRGLSHVFESDIDDYFNQIDHEILKSKLWQYVPEPDFHALLEQWLEIGGSEKGIPQGFSISPVLSNLYLDELDETMMRAGFRWVRYADDFVCLTSSRKMAESARIRVEEAIDPLGLRLNPDKTAITTIDHGLRFLGRLFIKSFIMEDSDGLNAREEKATLEWIRNHKDVEKERFSLVTGEAATGFRTLRHLSAPAAKIVQTPQREENLVDETNDGGRNRNIPTPRPEAQRPVLEDAEERPVSGGASYTRTLYLETPGYRLTLLNKSLAVRTAEGELVWAKSAHEVDRIDVGPKCDFEAPAVRLAAANGIPVFLVDGHGETTGVMESEPMHRSRLHLQQAAMILDPHRRLEIARILVAGKIENSRNVLKRWQRNRREALGRCRSQEKRERINGQLEAIAPLLKPMWSAAGRAKTSIDIPTLLGFEGEAAKLARKGMDATLVSYRFVRRQRRPAPDPVNAALNWVGWFLARDLRVMIRRSGLHPGFGALHESHDGKSACVYDLIEEFRAPVVDAIVLALFNRRLNENQMFSRSTTNQGEHLCRITTKGRRTLVRAYEHHVSKPFSDHNSNCWRSLMQQQVYRYMRHVREMETYATVEVDY